MNQSFNQSRLSTPELTQQLVIEPSTKLTAKPDQSTQVDKAAVIKDKQQPSKDKPDSVPINTPSPIKKKNDKAAKKRAKKLAAAIAKQQESETDSSIDTKKQKKGQQIKNTNTKKTKTTISKKKQALAGHDQPNTQSKSIEGSPQDIQKLVLGAFANMAAAIQSAAANVETKPSPMLKTKKSKAEAFDQDVIPEVVASGPPKTKSKQFKSKAHTTSIVSQNEQTQTLEEKASKETQCRYKRCFYRCTSRID
ncbi:hypothetical protein G6F42_026368 [Rhizopus arrhizus]|nr:hypothetical protein G6F42_026368 [Rhizopus arrhizus]